MPVTQAPALRSTIEPPTPQQFSDQESASSDASPIEVLMLLGTVIIALLVKIAYHLNCKLAE